MHCATLDDPRGVLFPDLNGDVRADDVLRFVEEYPKRPPVTLKKIRALTGVEYGTAEGPSGSTAPHGSFPGHENSGIVRSRQFPDLYWLHNDSGDEPRVYPIHGDGTDYQSARSSDRMGVLLGAAINVDWEDITVNESGQLIVCDLGTIETTDVILSFTWYRSQLHLPHELPG